ncbi:ubiquitin carboxyl-terminal hydrolase 15 [Trichomonascus vanleenenianus]|uniref:ubiquitin-specific protease UBP15 n=1 Tax=Trichomonascus vanleenenianus TaxID=2268995 RepID=UPI003ECA8EA2
MDHDEDMEVSLVQRAENGVETESTPMEVEEAKKELASDTELMKSKVFLPLDDLEVLDESVCTWEVEDWKDLAVAEEPKIHGPRFNAGGFEWSILLFPEGNRTDHVSVYLEAIPPPDKVKEDEEEEEDWAVCAQFGLVMWNPEDPGVFHYSQAHHRFQPDERDWGFTRFYDLRRLFSKDHLHTQLNGDTGGIMISDNRVNITAYVRVFKDPTGVLWHNFIRYDSKKETGLVGLKNQGATCYLNSLLQSLYFTKKFRQLVYRIPTENDGDSVTAALQRMFYLLGVAPDPIGTSKLTQSFGWHSGDAFTQHDVQELERVLMDKLESQMKGTEVENALNEIFVGQMKSYLRCVNVDFESSRVEDFWDLQLNVKGMRNLEDSFRNYVQVEIMEGENQYQAEGYGLQDAKKGVVFQSFPPVLHLQLKRYEYDFMRDMMVKVNDRYEFPLEVDLSPFMDEESIDHSESWEYALHGVLVHSGDQNAGHYYALIKPEADGDWFKFDDDRVTRATLKEVLEENYGGYQVPPGMPNGAGADYRRLLKRSNAYMLVYIRKSRLSEILSKTEDVIPEYIPRRIEQEDAVEAQRRKEEEEQQYYIDVKVMSNRQFKHYNGFDVAQWDNDGQPDMPEDARPLRLRVRYDSTLSQMYDLIADQLHTSPNSIRLWTMVSRQNKTFRLNSPLPNSNSITLHERRPRHAGRAIPETRYWVEDIERDSSGNPVLSTGDSEFEGAEANSNGFERSLIFIKRFDPATQQIVGVTTHTVDDVSTTGELADFIVKYMRWPANTQLNLYEEVKPEMIEEIEQAKSFKSAEISSGDIVCFEKVLTDKELHKINGCKNAIEFYDFMNNRILVAFQELSKNHTSYNLLKRRPKLFTLWLNRKINYDELCAQVAKHAGEDPTHLRFYLYNRNETVQQPVRRSGATLQQILSSGFMRTRTNVLMYEILDTSLEEYEKKQAVLVSYLTEGLSQEHKTEVMVPKTGTANELLQAWAQETKITNDVLGMLKSWTGRYGRMGQILDPESPISAIGEGVVVYVTKHTSDEIELAMNEEARESAKLVTVEHFHKDPSRTHSVPFIFVVKKDEPFSQTKPRLQKTLGYYDKVFESIRFAIVGKSGPRYLEEGEEDVVLYDEIGDDEILGLDHHDKSIRRGYGQAAIVMK